MKVMKGITCCGDCGYYNWQKHKCSRGCKDEGTAQDHFYKDCPMPDAQLISQWIPCSERLPEAEDLYEVAYPKLKQYLVQNKNGDMTVAHYIILSNKPYFESGSAVINNVIAWMPLPEPYKEEE